MNLASIIGWGVGFGAILISMAFTPTGLGVFWDLSSVFITVVGSIFFCSYGFFRSCCCKKNSNVFGIFL